MLEQLKEQLSSLKQRLEEKRVMYKEEMEEEGRKYLTQEQIKELNDDLAEISRLESKINREKENQEYQKKAICLSNNPKTPSSEQQNVTDTSQTN